MPPLVHGCLASWGKYLRSGGRIFRPLLSPPLSICIPVEPTWFVTGIKDARKNCMLDPQETPFFEKEWNNHIVYWNLFPSISDIFCLQLTDFWDNGPLKSSSMIYYTAAIILIKTFGSSWDKKMSLKIFFGPGAWFIRQILSLRAVRCVSATHMGSITVHYQQRTSLLSSARNLTG